MSLESRGREQPNVGTSATGYCLHLFRAGDGVPRVIEWGKLGRWRRARRGWQASRAQHARESRPGQVFFLGRVESWVGFKELQLLTSDTQTQVYTRCCCGQNRVQFSFSVRHAPRTPSDWLGGSVFLGLLLLSYTHIIIRTYISDHMH